MPKSRQCSRIEFAPGYSISRIINGCWQLSQGHGGNRLSRSDLERRIHALLDAGFTTFDCADIYTGVESLLGEVFAHTRPSKGVQIHTKYVPNRDQLAQLDARSIENHIDRSLRRLRVERLDLLQFHWWDYQVPGYLDTLQVLEGLRAKGKIRCLGVTNFDTSRMKEIAASGVRVASLQLQYSLLDRRADKHMRAWCIQNGVHLLCYGTLAGGLLASRNNNRNEQPNRSLTKYLLVAQEAGSEQALDDLMHALEDVSLRHGCTLAGVAARWVLDRTGVAAIMVGLGDRDHVKENLDLGTLQLDADDYQRIEAALGSLHIPPGDVFEFERDTEGSHAAIMKMNLNMEQET